VGMYIQDGVFFGTRRQNAAKRNQNNQTKKE